jgi:very-short-patch-repair endonuclease
MSVDTIHKHKKPKFKCPDCPARYISETLLHRHVGLIHKENIPDGVTIKQYCFNKRNNKEFQICVICKTNKTAWNEQSGRYNLYCSEECKRRAGQIAEENLKRKTGKTRKERMSDPDTQKSMLKNRSISGIYTFRDNKTAIAYVGSYELDFLEFYDKEYEGDPLDIIECPLVFNYIYENEKHFYCPDFYIPSLKLIIEIKDGGDNPNKHSHIEIDRKKDILKLKAVIMTGKYNFIKIINKEYIPFLDTVNILKERNASSECFNPLIVVPE